MRKNKDAWNEKIGKVGLNLLQTWFYVRRKVQLTRWEQIKAPCLKEQGALMNALFYKYVYT